MSTAQKLITKNYKLITILGPTASGKSELAVKLALRLGSGQAKKELGIKGAEIISADSRQVYKEMNIGTGKITEIEMQGIPHHLLDVASPKRKFTAVQYRKLALRAINKIFKKGKVPILCGGTGFYIQTLLEGIKIPEVAPDWQLRKRLEKHSIEELYQMLKKLDPRRARTIEKKNPRRLIRAIEIIKKTKKPIPFLKKKPLPYSLLIMGIKKSTKELNKLIKKRFLNWLKRGLIKEVKNLRKLGLSWKKIEDFGIHYRTIAQYLQKKLNYKEMIEKSLIELQNYAKRQMTWFKKYFPQTHWVKNQNQAEKLIKDFFQ